MADYSDAYSDRWVREEQRNSLIAELRGRGFKPFWKAQTLGYDARHILHLGCLWCGVLVWDDKLHRQFCKAPIAGVDPEPGV